MSDPILLGRFRYTREDSRLLDEDGNDVFLRPQSALVLGVLARKPGTVVSKDELISEVWQHISVTDASLTQCVADIRRAIEDKDREIVKTLPKRGYLLAVSTASKDSIQPVVDVESIAHAVGAAATPMVLIETSNPVADASDLMSFISTKAAEFGAKLRPATPGSAILETDTASHAIQLALAASQDPQAGGRFRVALDLCPFGGARAAFDTPRVHALAGLAAAGEIIATEDVQGMALDELDCAFEDMGERRIGSGLIRLYRVHANAASSAAAARSPASFAALRPTIAVIPFENRLPGNPGLLGEVIADDIISALSRSVDVNVISRLSTRVFNRRSASLAEVGHVLQTDYVLSGSYVEHGTQLILTIELSDVRSSQVLWTDRLSGDLAMVLQDLEMVQKIVAHVRRAIFISEIREVKTHPLKDLANHNLLLGAIGLMHRLSVRDFQTARILLDALVARVPEQPAPRAWLARWHVLRVQQGWSDSPGDEAQAALREATAALDIDPENALALASEGMVLTNLTHKLDEAEDRYNTALEYNPNDPYGRLLRGALYSFQGKGPDARKDTDHALHLAPLDPHRFFFLALAAGANLAAEDYGRALALAETSLRMNRTHTSTLRVKLVAQMRLGQGDEARATAQTLMQLQPSLRVNTWLKNSPTREYEFGRSIARDLKTAGIPE